MCPDTPPVRFALSVQLLGVIAGVLLILLIVFAGPHSGVPALASNPQPAVVIDTPGDVVAIDTTIPDWLFAADSEAGLQIIDVADLSQPTIAAWVPLDGLTQDVCVVDSYAYIALDGGPKAPGSLVIVSVKAPASPGVLGLVQVLGDAAAVDVHGAYAYVADSTKEMMHIIDIRNPMLPRIVNSLPASGSARDVTVKDGYAYVATYGTRGKSGLDVFDVAIGTHARRIATVDVPEYGAHVVELIDGDVACVGGDDRLTLIDISRPESPRVLVERHLPDPVHAIGGIEDGDRIVVGALSADLFAFDLQDPSAPELDDRIENRASIWDAEADASHLFLACGTTGVVVYDALALEDSILDECLAGSVDGRRGAPADILLINGQAGDATRTVHAVAGESIEVRLDAPPSDAEGPARFALYIWAGRPSDATIRVLPLGLGFSCMTTPLTGDGPAPLRVFNNLGSPSLLGYPDLDSSPAPTLVGRKGGGLGRPGEFFLQGLIVDKDSGSGKLATTNGVLLLVE